MEHPKSLLLGLYIGDVPPLPIEVIQCITSYIRCYCPCVCVCVNHKCICYMRCGRVRNRKYGIIECRSNNHECVCIYSKMCLSLNHECVCDTHNYKNCQAIIHTKCKCHVLRDCCATKHECICYKNNRICFATEHKCSCNTSQNCRATRHQCSCSIIVNKHDHVCKGTSSHQCICFFVQGDMGRYLTFRDECQSDREHRCSCCVEPDGCKNKWKYKHECVCSQYPDKCKVGIYHKN